MSQHWSRALQSANETCPEKMKGLLPGLNALAESLLIARARQEDPWGRTPSVSRLAALGLDRDDVRDLLARAFVASDGDLSPSTPIVLTDAGLAIMQLAIPFGAVRPVYDGASRKLSVAGEIILPLATQARNLSALLKATEAAGWPPRVRSPLGGRPCGNDAHHLADSTHRLNKAQTLIDFHSDDGSATWNWRPRTTSGQD